MIANKPFSVKVEYRERETNPRNSKITPAIRKRDDLHACLDILGSISLLITFLSTDYNLLEAEGYKERYETLTHALITVGGLSAAVADEAYCLVGELIELTKGESKAQEGASDEER
jgi:hypothetical protein